MAKPNKTPKINNKEEVPADSQAQQSGTQPIIIPANTFTKFIKGKEIYLLLVAMTASCFFIFHDFISLEKVYLYKDIGSDSVNIGLPWLTHLSEYIKHNGVPSWTFSQGMGQNAFPLWLGDFFSDIMMLFGKDNIPYLMAFAEIMKVILCGLVFFKYLTELKLSRYTAYIGAFLFAFSGYVILGGCWMIFSAEALYVAMILYGFERWLNKGKVLWFVLGITSLGLLQPFFLFPYTLLLAVYIPVRYNDVFPTEWKRFPLFLGKTLGLAIIAVAITSYQLFPDLLQYIESPRVGGDARLIENLKAQPAFAIADSSLRFTTTFRAFGSDIIGTGSEFKGWQNYLEAPLFYCGILCLIIFPQAFLSFNKRQKIAYGILAGVFTLPIFFPFFRYTFWAYTGNYFRAFSLVITFLLLLFSARGLEHILKTRKVSLIVLGTTLIVLLFLLFTPTAEFAEKINQGVRSTSTLLLFVYAGLLWGLTRANHVRNICLVLLALCCFLEMTLYSSTTVNERDNITGKELTERVGYNDYTMDALKYVKSHDKGFYRVNKDYFSGPAIHVGFNDSKMQGYFGTTSYHSFNQKNYVKFLGDLGVINPRDELQTRWIKGLGERPLLMSLTSGKYWLCKKPADQLKAFGYDSVGKFNDVYLYKNNYAVPLGVAYGQLLEYKQFTRLSQAQKDLYLLKGCVIDSGDNELLTALPKYNLADTAVPSTLELYFNAAKTLSHDSLTITQFKESHIKGEINTTTPKILFFTIPFDEGWSATVNGAATPLHRINCGMTGLKIPAGTSKVELQFEPRYMKKGALVSVVGLLVFAGVLGMGLRKGKAIKIT